MNRKTCAFLVTVVALSRIPLLVTGFGSDGDAWRIADSALRVWNGGAYEVSRIPGFPLYELVNVPLIGLGGSLASNFTTLVAFILGVFALQRLLGRWAPTKPNQPLLLILFSFHPLLWTNSATTMDYVWGMAAILFSTLLFLDRRYLAAGIMMGLAAGTRITHLLYVLPFFLLLERADRKYWVKYLAYAAITTMVMYTPVAFSSSYAGHLADFNPGIWNEPLWKLAGSAVYRLVYTFGPLGFMALVYVFVRHKRELRALVHTKEGAFSFAVITLTVLFFAALPDESEYLIPMIPFVLILLFLVASRNELVVTTVLTLSFAFITVDIVKHSGFSPALEPRIERGLVIREYESRKDIDRWRTSIATVSVPDSSVIMTGVGPMFGLGNYGLEPDEPWGTMLRQRVYKREKAAIYYVYSLNLTQLDSIRDRGYRVFYVDRAKEYLESFVGYRMSEQGIQEIDRSTTE